MAYSSLGTKRQPQFADGDAPDVAVNPSQVANYAAEYGNYKVDTAAARTSATSWAWEGLLWRDTDGTKLLYEYSGSAWVAVGGAPVAGSVTATGAFVTTGTTVERDAFRWVDVFLQVAGSVTVAGEVMTISAGFRPAIAFFMPVSFTGGTLAGAAGSVRMGVDGKVTTYPPAGTYTGIYGQLRFRAV